MKHAPPAPPELGTRDGLSYALFRPEGDPPAGVVIVHGAGSAKESHFDFARNLRGAGLLALAYDVRGHGRSAGEFGPTAFGDVLSMCDLVREHAPAVSIRGSSLGGWQAIHAAALDSSIAAVVALCPAHEERLLGMLRSPDEVYEMRVDRELAARWIAEQDIFAAVTKLAPRTGLLLLHAQGDEQIPYTVSEELYAAALEPKRLVVVPGGHHRSLQHDMEIQDLSRRFVLEAVGRRA
ncbi:MAG: lysophospholipase [Actinomycetota bacterium]|nr:lysophospholipase [Actinomycetota bacterium]